MAGMRMSTVPFLLPEPWGCPLCLGLGPQLTCVDEQQREGPDTGTDLGRQDLGGL